MEPVISFQADISQHRTTASSRIPGLTAVSGRVQNRNGYMLLTGSRSGPSFLHWLNGIVDQMKNNRLVVNTPQA